MIKESLTFVRVLSGMGAMFVHELILISLQELRFIMPGAALAL
jgi:hypothetical protein